MKNEIIMIYEADIINKNGLYIHHDVLKESISSLKTSVFGNIEDSDCKDVVIDSLELNGYSVCDIENGKIIDCTLVSIDAVIKHD